jgi:hypothetical protein
MMLKVFSRQASGIYLIQGTGLGVYLFNDQPVR